MPALVTIHAIDLGWTIITDLVPNSLSESKSAAFDQQQIRGRSVPIYGYSHSETRTVDLSIVLSCIDGAGIESTSPPLQTGADVWRCVNWLKSAVYPRYSGLIFPPTRIELQVGNFIYVPTCVLTSISISWGDTIDENGYAMKAEVSLTFEEVQATPSSATEVQGRGY